MTEKSKEIKKLAEQLVELLKNNYHPHTVIIITEERTVVVEDILSIPNLN